MFHLETCLPASPFHPDRAPSVPCGHRERASLLARLATLSVALASVLSFFVATKPLHAGARFVIVNQDDPGEGLNDTSPFTAVAGNSAVTLGGARLQAVEFAAALWAQSLESSEPIKVGVRFDPLGGSASAATLGLSSVPEVFRDFTGAPLALTWYLPALGDRLAGLDLSAGQSVDLELILNSDVDGSAVLGDTTFYYGLDHNPPPGQVSLIAVAAHELVHGLGFRTFVDLATGEKFFGYDDAFMTQLEHRGAVPPDFRSMTDAQRLAAITAEPDLVWAGPNAPNEAGKLLSGVTLEGQPLLHAPPVPDPLSSLVHFSTSLSPNDVVEPIYSPVTDLDYCLMHALLADIGWGTHVPCGGCIGTTWINDPILSGTVTHESCGTLIVGPEQPGGTVEVTAGAEVTLKAGLRISLLPGFKVHSGATLRLLIDPTAGQS